MIGVLILSLLAAAPLARAAGPPPSLARTASGQAVSATGDRRLEGVVVDTQGLPVVGARLTLLEHQGGVRRMAVSSVERFELTGLPAAAYDLQVEADGFQTQTVAVDLRTNPVVVLTVRLVPAAVVEQVVVTATRTEQRLGNVPASVHVLQADEIRQSPAVVADDVLRQVPTFSLFRRTSSLSSHPTAQGVSLRGIGPSGVSRTLVLLDGVPFNDPFGGWVYWTRVPLESTQRIEVVDSSTSSLYGNYAMGGVINIVTSRPTRRTLEVTPQYGNHGSPKADFVASNVWGPVGAALDGSFFRTSGYPIVAADERGPVDNNATVDFRNLNLKLEYTPGERLSAFLRAGYFREQRNNGKASTIDGAEEANDTTWKSASGGVRLVLPDRSDLQARLFTDFETFHSTFLAVPASTPPRSFGRMSLAQEVPTTGVGGMAQWSKALGATQYLTAGADWRRVDGDSRERVLDPQRGETPTLFRTSGGTQQSVGAFVQDLITPVPKLQLTLSARVDHWRNYDGHNLEVSAATGLPTPNNGLLPARGDTVASPRVAALYHVSDRVSAWGDLGWGFRAPTLNELYRQFRVGSVVTLANDQLGPERQFGGEAGVNVAATRDLTWRATWFEDRVTDPVSNVTQRIVGSTITRQRQNLGRTHVRGLQTDLDYRFGSFWRLSGGYLYDRATVSAFAADPTLVGNVLPQVPSHRGTLQVVYADPRYATVAVQAQVVARQFDDDQNRFVLPAYGVADVQVTRTLREDVDLFLGVQNVFDHVVIVGTNPTTIGSPRLVTVGVRLRVTGR